MTCGQKKLESGATSLCEILPCASLPHLSIALESLLKMRIFSTLSPLYVLCCALGLRECMAPTRSQEDQGVFHGLGLTWHNARQMLHCSLKQSKDFSINVNCAQPCWSDFEHTSHIRGREIHSVINKERKKKERKGRKRKSVHQLNQGAQSGSR